MKILDIRNSCPFQYPLKEVVVVHKDPEVLNDVISLEKYIMEELNLRSVTTSSDKKKYGVKLTAQPDFKALGGKHGLFRGEKDLVSYNLNYSRTNSRK